MAFAEHGFERTTIEEITRNAEVAVGGFYQYFHSKQQILLVLMDELLAELDAMELGATAAVHPMQLIETFVAQSLSTDLRYAGAYRAWREVMLHDDQFAQLDSVIQSWTTGRIASLLEQLGQLPGARTDVNHATMAWMLNILFWELILRTTPEQTSTVVATTTSMITRTLFT